MNPSEIREKILSILRSELASGQLKGKIRVAMRKTIREIENASDEQIMEAYRKLQEAHPIVPREKK